MASSQRKALADSMPPLTPSRTSGASPSKRERGMYSECVDQDVALDDVQLGQTAEASVAQPGLDFDAARAEYTSDIGASTAHREHRFPESAQNPKVQIPHSPRPGKTPREIAVRRKRRQYDMNSLETLLQERIAP